MNIFLYDKDCIITLPYYLRIDENSVMFPWALIRFLLTCYRSTLNIIRKSSFLYLPYNFVLILGGPVEWRNGLLFTGLNGDINVTKVLDFLLASHQFVL